MITFSTWKRLPGENCTSCSYLDLPIGGPWPRISCDEMGPHEGPSRLTLGVTAAILEAYRTWEIIHMGPKTGWASWWLVKMENFPKPAVTWGLGLMIICWVLGWEFKPNLKKSNELKLFYQFANSGFIMIYPYRIGSWFEFSVQPKWFSANLPGDEWLYSRYPSNTWSKHGLPSKGNGHPLGIRLPTRIPAKSQSIYPM